MYPKKECNIKAKVDYTKDSYTKQKRSLTYISYFVISFRSLKTFSQDIIQLMRQATLLASHLVTVIISMQCRHRGFQQNSDS